MAEWKHTYIKAQLNLIVRVSIDVISLFFTQYTNNLIICVARVKRQQEEKSLPLA